MSLGADTMQWPQQECWSVDCGLWTRGKLQRAVMKRTTGEADITIGTVVQRPDHRQNGTNGKTGASEGTQGFERTVRRWRASRSSL
jgi:hypothetical protein